MAIKVVGTDTICWETEISYAHFINNIKSKCFAVHGHDARIEIEIQGQKGKDGMILDFNLLNLMVKMFDHKWIISEKMVGMKDNKDFHIHINDNMFIDISQEYMKVAQPLMRVPIDEITAENLAQHLAEKIHSKLIQIGIPIYYIKVTWWEDSRSKAIHRITTKVEGEGWK